MKRIAFLLLASSMSVSVLAGPENWSFVQSVGGIEIGAPFLHHWGWVLPVRADVSGRQRVTTKPTRLDSALVCERTDVAVEGRNIYITVATEPATRSTRALLFPDGSSRCLPVMLGEVLPGKYEVFYRGPSDTPVRLGEVSLGEDGPVDAAKIAKAIRQADKVVVFEGVSTDSKVLFNSTSVKDIAEFNDALSLAPPPPPPPKDRAVCACGPFPAGPVIRLYRGGKELVLVTNLNKNPVGQSRWGRQAILIQMDREKWLRWFDARKIPAPLSEREAAYEAARARNKKGSEAR